MAITSSNVSPGDTVLAAQQNSIVTDLTSLDTDRGLNNTHRGLTNNPHSVDSSDVGLNNVNNTADASQTSLGTVTSGNVDAIVNSSSVGLGSVQNYGIASQAEAEAGSSNAKYMTPLRGKELLDSNFKHTQYNWTSSPYLTQTLTVGTARTVNWQQRVDNGGFISSTGTTSTIPTGLGGLYLLFATVWFSFVSTGVGNLRLNFIIEGYTLANSYILIPNLGGSYGSMLAVSLVVELSATDTVAVSAKASTGFSSASIASGDSNFNYGQFSGIKLS